MGDEPPNSPRAKRKASSPYERMELRSASQPQRVAGSMGSSSRPYWRTRILDVVRAKAPNANIASTCSTHEGNTRFLFASIEIDEIESVKNSVYFGLRGLCTYGFIDAPQSVTSRGSSFRVDEKTFFVDLLPDADETMRKRANMFNTWCNLYAILCFLALVVAAWSWWNLRDHFRDYETPFAHQREVFRQTIERMTANSA